MDFPNRKTLIPKRHIKKNKSTQNKSNQFRCVCSEAYLLAIIDCSFSIVLLQKPNAKTSSGVTVKNELTLHLDATVGSRRVDRRRDDHVCGSKTGGMQQIRHTQPNQEHQVWA